METVMRAAGMQASAYKTGLFLRSNAPMFGKFAAKLASSRIWKRIFLERLTEPLHLNLLSVPVAVFGSFEQKVAFDLVLRQHNAYGILKAARIARRSGIAAITVAEFGVAAGAGIANMCDIASRVETATGVKIRVIGFDTGKGMPPPADWRDHPDLYGAGDFPMDFGRLRAQLPASCELVLGELRNTVPAALAAGGFESCPLGYAVIDVDYYSSTRQALRIFEGPPQNYLPLTVVYLDDIMLAEHNPKAGELLAVAEFNASFDRRVICRHEFLETERIFTRAMWLKQICFLHVMDHPLRAAPKERDIAVLGVVIGLFSIACHSLGLVDPAMCSLG